MLTIKSAEISACGQYRWWLKRVWDRNKSLLVVVMLNPSTADASQDDPTILTLIHFAKLWGAGGLYIVNQYAFRSPHPAVMAAASDPIGEENWYHLQVALAYAYNQDGSALAAWGNGGDNNGLFVEMAAECGVDLYCLGTTANGSPKHPLARGKHRIPRDQRPILWRKAPPLRHVAG